MRRIIPIIIIFISSLLNSCAGNSKALKLGNSPLTITVISDDKTFDGFANIYLNGQFIGTTDNKSQSLKISLKKGEYTVIVIAEGYQPSKSKVILLGDGYKQNVLARLKKSEQENSE